MRILVINNYYPPYDVGGYEQLCQDVCRNLAARGHQLTVLTSNVGAASESRHRAIEVRRQLRLSPDYDARLSPLLQFFLTRRRDEAYNRRCFQQLVADFKPDVVFIWNLQHLPYSLAIDAESLNDSVTAYWLAGYSPADNDAFWRYWQLKPSDPVRRVIKGILSGLAFRQLANEAKPVRPLLKHVAVVSNFERETGIDQGTLPEHTRVIPNGVEVDLFFRAVETPRSGPLRLLQAGRLNPDKGAHISVEALGLLLREFGVTGVVLRLVGDGPQAYREVLEHLVVQYDLKNRVEFVGKIPREEMPSLMAQSDVLLLPTVNDEPFARVVLEAMAGGLTVVGTPTGGTGELLRHNETGLTFVAGDSRDLALQLQKLVQDRELARRLANAGQEQVLASFTFPQMVDSLEEFLIGSLDHRRTRSQALQESVA